MEELLKQLDAIRRWRTLVVLIAVIAAVSALFLSLTKESTFSAQTTMFVGSSTQDGGNAPEQDAVTARSYVEFLNNPANQAPLRAGAGIGDDVDVTASNVADGPVIYITATAPGEDEAIAASGKFAQAFEKSLTTLFKKQFDGTIEPLRREFQSNNTEIAAAQAELDSGTGLTAAQRVERQATIRLLQSENSSLTSQIESLRGAAGNSRAASVYQSAQQAEENSPGVLRNTVLGLIGGGILGIVVAMVLGSLQSRVDSPEEVRARLDLPTLATVSTGNAEQRAEDLRALSSGLSLMPGQAQTLAVTSAVQDEGKTMVASNLARIRAGLGDRVILIDANLRQAAGGASGKGRKGGLAAILGRSGQRTLDDELVPSGIPNMSVLPAGGPASDPYSLMSSERMRALLEQAAPLADLIVLDTPSLLTAAESQVVCSLCDQTILVVDSNSTGAKDAVQARDLLERVNANTLGVVLTRVNK